MPADTYGSITDEGLANLEDRIGVEIDEPEPYVHEATLDTIRHWAHGIGCDDPLYTDPEYAAAGPHGELVAPPTFLYATSKIVSGYVGGLPGVHAMYAGTDWTWHEPIRRDTAVEPSSHLSELIERDTDFSGRSIQQVYTTEFRDGEGTLLAEADSWCFRTERDTASKDKRKYESEGVELAEWDEEDVAEFADHYREERPRGAKPRHFESVSAGDELDTLLKGPMTITNVIAFDQGWGGLYVEGHGRFFDMIDDHPALSVPNSQGSPEPPEQVHWNDEFAQAVGVPAAYDYGPERVSWLGHVCHHWMGDHGRLRSLRGEVRRHNLMGDVTWCGGEVTDTYREGGENLVDVDLEAHNHRDELTAKGSATIALPSEGDV
jgi:acyl dehydratase